jgi:hypothetical protein
MKNIDRIKKTSRRFRILFIVIMVITPLIPVALIMMSNELPGPMRTQLFKDSLVPIRETLSFQTRLFASTASLLTSGIAMTGLFFIIRLFRLYETGKIFAKEHVTCFRRLGYILIIYMFAGIIRNSLVTIILTLANPPGQRIISLGFSSSDLTKLFIGLVLLLISRVMDIGREIQEEQQLTV